MTDTTKHGPYFYAHPRGRVLVTSGADMREHFRRALPRATEDVAADIGTACFRFGAQYAPVYALGRMVTLATELKAENQLHFEILRPTVYGYYAPFKAVAFHLPSGEVILFDGYDTFIGPSPRIVAHYAEAHTRRDGNEREGRSRPNVVRYYEVPRLRGVFVRLTVREQGADLAVGRVYKMGDGSVIIDPLHDDAGNEIEWANDRITSHDVITEAHGNRDLEGAYRIVAGEILGSVTEGALFDGAPLPRSELGVVPLGRRIDPKYDLSGLKLGKRRSRR